MIDIVSAGCKQGMQYGVPFPLFRRFGKGIERSYLKSNPREAKIPRKYGIKISKVRGKNQFEKSN